MNLTNLFQMFPQIPNWVWQTLVVTLILFLIDMLLFLRVRALEKANLNFYQTTSPIRRFSESQNLLRLPTGQVWGIINI